MATFKALSKTRRALQKTKAATRKVKAAQKHAGKAKQVAGKGWRLISSTYVCTKCNPHREFKERDRKLHDEYHANARQYGNPGDRGNAPKLENVIARAQKEAERRAKQSERERSAAVVAERAKREASKPKLPPQPKQGEKKRKRPKKDYFAATHKLWTPEINKIGAVLMGQAQPSTPTQQAAVGGPAAGLLHAANTFGGAVPADHHEMRALMLSFDAATKYFAEQTLAFQEQQVRRGFHPAAMRPLDGVSQHLLEARFGFTHTLMQIERIYAPFFEITHNPGAQYFGNQGARAS